MIIFVCDGQVFNITGRGRLATGRIANSLYKQPSNSCVLVRGGSTILEFISSGIETNSISGPGNITAVGIPKGLQIEVNDIIGIKTDEDLFPFPCVPENRGLPHAVVG